MRRGDGRSSGWVWGGLLPTATPPSTRAPLFPCAAAQSPPSRRASMHRLPPRATCLPLPAAPNTPTPTPSPHTPALQGPTQRMRCNTPPWPPSRVPMTTSTSSASRFHPTPPPALPRRCSASAETPLPHPPHPPCGKPPAAPRYSPPRPTPEPPGIGASPNPQSSSPSAIPPRVRTPLLISTKPHLLAPRSVQRAPLISPPPPPPPRTLSLPLTCPTLR